MTPVKALNANQHVLLHQHYGPHDCCLCKSESAVDRLQNELGAMRMDLDLAVDSIKTLRYVLGANEYLQQRIAGAERLIQDAYFRAGANDHATNREIARQWIEAGEFGPVSVQRPPSLSNESTFTEEGQA